MAELRAVVPVSSAIIPREGADQQVTTLGPHAIATAAGSQGTFGGWTCTDAPSAGDVAFPTGTTTGAVTFGDAGSASTTVTFPGPGYYELTADIGGETETLGIYVTRPLPVIGTTLASGAGTAGGSVAPTLSDSGGADSVTYSTEVIQGSDASSVSVTGSTTSTPSWTNPTQDADGDSVMATSVATDAYGRTSKVSRVLDLAGSGGGGGVSFTVVEGTVFTGTSTGALSGGANVIDGKTWTASIASGHSFTDDANGVRSIATGAGNFSYLYRDVLSALADVDRPFYFAMSFDDFTIADGGNVGIGLYSSGNMTSLRAPMAQLRVNRSGAAYNVQGIHSTGAVANTGGFTVIGSSALGGAPTSAVLEMYVWGNMVAMRWRNSTTTIPIPSDPRDVLADSTNYWIASMATGGYAPGSTPAWWTTGIAVGLIIGGGSAQDAQADILEYTVQEA